MKYLIFILIPFAAQSQYKDTTFTETNNVSNRVFKNLRINGTQIRGYGWNNVRIENCQIVNIPKSKKAIDISSSNGMVVVNCYFENCGAGVYMNGGSNPIVRNNNFKNMTGPNDPSTHFGQAVQFNGINGGDISLNYILNEPGKSDNEDLISVHKSNGTASNPIKVDSNYINGGGPSTSGGGIMNENSNYVVARGNVLINPGQYGMAIRGGNTEYSGNKIYGKQQSFTNVGLYIWKDQIACTGNKILNNEVYWVKSNGSTNHFWDGGGCTSVNTGNVWGSTNVNESMPPPVGCGVQGVVVTPPIVVCPDCPTCPPQIICPPPVVCPPKIKKIVTMVYDENGVLVNTTTINL